MMGSLRVLPGLAARNVAKNIRRSLITGGGVALTLGLLIVFGGVIRSSSDEVLRSLAITGTGHLQVHRAGYHLDPDPFNLITDSSVYGAVEALPGVVAWAPRLEAGGLVSSPTKTRGAAIVGVDTAKEPQVSVIPSSLVVGEGLRRGRCLLGKGLYDVLGVEPGDKVVVLTQDVDGGLAAEAWRVAGAFYTGTYLDRAGVVAPLEDVQELLGVRGATSIVILTSDLGEVPKLKARLSDALGPDYEVLTYYEMMPAVYSALQLRKVLLWILSALAYLIASFGILNTTLMSITERTREFGVLMALGLRPGHLVAMVLLETLFLVGLGVLAGSAFGIPITLLLAKIGIPIPGLELITSEFNIPFLQSRIYAKFTWDYYLGQVGLLVGVSVFSTLYPLYKVARMEPARAMRWV